MKTIIILLAATLPLNAGKIEEERLQREAEFKRSLEQSQRDTEAWVAREEAKRAAEEAAKQREKIIEQQEEIIRNQEELEWRDRSK